MLINGQQREAMLYHNLEKQRVLCLLCPHYCQIESGQQGICHVRENKHGTLYTHVYGRTVNQSLNSIEKKPLFHFYPASTTYSLATSGCNFHCQYCTNWEVSQMPIEQYTEVGTVATPEEIVESACETGCRSIAYTYVEPTIFFEYIHEIATLARKVGLLNVFKTNGFLSREMLEIGFPYWDAANVDLKTFRDKTYRWFGGRLQPVLDGIRMLKKYGVWIEITTVIIPGVNDEISELEDLARFIALEVGMDTPWHIARFFPAYQMNNVPPTPVETLHTARQIGLSCGLRYVYLANFLEQGAQDSVCHECGQILIQRRGFQLLENRMRDKSCPFCGTLIPGVGLADKLEQL
jgi:pyruvate formate lyase activating enzyme